MDYGRLNRKDLQALCKQHGIPANKTNVFMAEALGDLLNAPKEEEPMESIPDPAEAVKSKASSRRARADVLKESELADLSSQLAKSSIAVTVSVEDTVEDAVTVSVEESVVEVSTEVLPELEKTSGVVAVPVKASRRTRSKSTKSDSKSFTSVLEAVPALIEPTLEVVLEPENTLDPPDSPRAKVPSEPRAYARRVPKVMQNEENAGDSVEPLSLKEDLLTKVESMPPVDESQEEDSGAAEGGKKILLVVKKRRAKVKQLKDIKPESPRNAGVLEDAVVPPTTDSSPAPGLHLSPSTEGIVTIDTIPVRSFEAPLELPTDFNSSQDVPRAARISPAPGDEAFEFHPVPESFAEIMTPAKPLVEASKGCQHRLGRKAGKACKSCASEMKGVSLMRDVLQGISVPDPNAPHMEPVTEAVETEEIQSTPVKEGDDKENALKNMDLHTLSIRKLQREVKRRGLSKRNNTKVKV